MNGVLGRSGGGPYAAFRPARASVLGATAPAASAPPGTPMCANPLPPGRYALTVFDKPVGAVRAMRIWTEDTKGVSVEAAARVDADGLAFAGPTAVIFTVSQPALWNYSIFGCPNVVNKSFTIKDLTQATAPKDFWSAIFGDGAGSGIPFWVYLLGGGIVLVALAPTLFEVSKVVALHEEHKT